MDYEINEAGCLVAVDGAEPLDDLQNIFSCKIFALVKIEIIPRCEFEFPGEDARERGRGRNIWEKPETPIGSGSRESRRMMMAITANEDEKRGEGCYGELRRMMLAIRAKEDEK